KEGMSVAAKVVSLQSGAGENSTGLALSEAGQHLGIALIARVLSEVNDAQIRGAFSEMAQQGFDAATVDAGGSFLAYRALIIELAGKYRLMAYAPDLGELAERLANDVHQILNGAKPG